MIRVENISKAFCENTYVFKNVSFEIEKGELAFLIGASGSGKTTLLNILFRELLPNEGDGNVLGSKLSEITPRNLHHFRKKIGFIFQDSRLIQSRTVFENVSFVTRIFGYKKSESVKMVDSTLEMVGLKDKKDLLPAQLSGGEQQKVAIARAIVNRPALILADEPAGSLDSEKAIEVMDLFYKMVGIGTTVLVATHNFELVEFMRRKTLLLSNGTLRDVSAK